ncbi:MAG TPA: hypothetical protein VN934_05650 [Candidatus Tumulicola sp.]|nr:hypothetical protein [Candidatus Tumulicola sp.]
MTAATRCFTLANGTIAPLSGSAVVGVGLGVGLAGVTVVGVAAGFAQPKGRTANVNVSAIAPQAEVRMECFNQWTIYGSGAAEPS